MGAIFILVALFYPLFEGMVGDILAALIVGKNNPSVIHNGPQAGLVAVCAGSDLMHPLGALMTGAIAGSMFVWLFTLTQNR
jgi:Amt family ammonium transporter